MVATDELGTSSMLVYRYRRSGSDRLLCLAQQYGYLHGPVRRRPHYSRTVYYSMCIHGAYHSLTMLSIQEYACRHTSLPFSFLDGYRINGTVTSVRLVRPSVSVIRYDAPSDLAR